MKKLHIQQTGDIEFSLVYEEDNGDWDFVPDVKKDMTLREAEEALLLQNNRDVKT